MNKKDVDPLFKSFSYSLLNTVGYIIVFFIVISVLGIKGTSVITVLGAAGTCYWISTSGEFNKPSRGNVNFII